MVVLALIFAVLTNFTFENTFLFSLAEEHSSKEKRPDRIYTDYEPPENDTKAQNYMQTQQNYMQTLLCTEFDRRNRHGDFTDVCSSPTNFALESTLFKDLTNTSKRSKRIAVILRGQAFRNGADFERNTEPICSGPPQSQFEAAKKYFRLFDKIEAAGYGVDCFIATYQCPNQSAYAQTYVDRLIRMFSNSSRLVQHVILENAVTADDPQLVNLRAAVRLATFHMIDFDIPYDFWYVLRLDYSAEDLPPNPFPELPRELITEDFGQVIPARFIPCYTALVGANKWEMSPFPQSIFQLRYEVVSYERKAQQEAEAAKTAACLEAKQGAALDLPEYCTTSTASTLQTSMSCRSVFESRCTSDSKMVLEDPTFNSSVENPTCWHGQAFWSTMWDYGRVH